MSKVEWITQPIFVGVTTLYLSIIIIYIIYIYIYIIIIIVRVERLSTPRLSWERRGLYQGMSERGSTQPLNLLNPMIL